MEALLLAGGMAERLGEAAQGLPKPLVPVAGYPLAEYTVARLVDAGVTRVIVACRAGQEEVFVNALAGLGAEIEPVGEPEPLGRGGGLRLAASHRREEGTVLALNGDELLDVDFRALSTSTTAPPPPRRSSSRRCTRPWRRRPPGRRLDHRLREAPKLPHWVNSGVYALGEEAVARLPERGDHEQSTFPELAAEGKLRGYRHDGVWLTVNNPKDLRRAEEFMQVHPEWRPRRRLAMSGLDALALRAAPRREAVGLGAHLGRGRGVRRQDPLRPRRPLAQPPVPPGEGRELVRAERPCRARAGGGGGRTASRSARSGPATASATARAPCTA